MINMLFFDYRPTEEKFFEKNDFVEFNIKFFNDSLNSNFLKNLTEEERLKTEAISVFIKSDIDEKVLNAFPNLKLVASRSTGLNHINLEACKSHNVVVKNVSDYGAKSVVQYTIGLMICLLRHIMPAVLDSKKLESHPQKYIGKNLDSLTLGVVGTGAIGCYICKFARFSGMRILAYDIKPKSEFCEECRIKYVDLDRLIEESDVITLHLPYKENNYHMFSKKEFSRMKKTAYFINTSRGEIVDTYALYEALVNKEIQGCALDVSECEDMFSNNNKNLVEYIHSSSSNCLGRALILQKMMEMPNVIITPHIAYSTEEAFQSILEVTMENIIKFFDK